MSGAISFGLVLLVASGVGLVAIMSSRASQRLLVPSPAIFLLGAATAAQFIPRLHSVLTVEAVDQVVTVALVVILFDGGMGIGWRKFRSAAAPIMWLGVLGTALTALAVAGLAHFLFGFGWLPAMILGTALSPTDPAVVFAVLGRHEVHGRSSSILEGEAGVNDPVGIALMLSLIAASGTSSLSPGSVALEFFLQMAVGGVIGLGGGYLLLQFMRRVALPRAGLYPLRALAAALLLYAIATVAHGSGFLAVFVAGIMVGDQRFPYWRDIERFHSALASLAEIVAFLLLGITVHLQSLAAGGVWWIGLAMAVLLGLLVRPVLVGGLLLPVRLRWGERGFIVWSGLKGAVPLLLGSFALVARLQGSARAYDVIFVVVAFSVVVQGGLVFPAARHLRIPMRLVQLEPWGLGVTLRHQPPGLQRFLVVDGSVADGATVADLGLNESVWVSLIIRHGALVPVGGATRLKAGDEVLTLPEPSSDMASVFERPPPPES
ncbi:MAG TPA: cation:proton antiporter [Candidatus Nanopelagicaceae bacterium]|nr:cation:proton antiporter [Candidatus Nanopelagicaceae bacterium]